MISTNRNNQRTDRAWNRLYGRLNEDGLLPASPAEIAARHSTAWKWGSAAAAVIVVICLVTFHFQDKSLPAGMELIAQQNMEETTLVTTLEDGSIVYLAGQTSLQYPEHFAPDKREVSLEGDALFDITGNRKRPFVIETEQVRIEVLGTAFNVKSDEHSPFRLSVKRGEVKVTSKLNGDNIHVKSGETVTLLSEKLELTPTQDSGQFEQYTRNIRFKDERLADIIRVINLREQKTCLQASSELGERILTVTLTDDSPEQIAQLICLVLNSKYTCEQGIFTLTE